MATETSPKRSKDGDSHQSVGSTETSSGSDGNNGSTALVLKIPVAKLKTFILRKKMQREKGLRCCHQFS